MEDPSSLPIEDHACMYAVCSQDHKQIQHPLPSKTKALATIDEWDLSW